MVKMRKDGARERRIDEPLPRRSAEPGIHRCTVHGAGYLRPPRLLGLAARPPRGVLLPAGLARAPGATGVGRAGGSADADPAGTGG